MNIQHLRHSLKVKWLLYYRQNRPWMARLRIWGTYDGQRRPSSSFILATLSILEPELTEMFSFVVDLNNHPDQIIAALGLNFNPDVELQSLTEPSVVTSAQFNSDFNFNPDADLQSITDVNPVAASEDDVIGTPMNVVQQSVEDEVDSSPSSQATNLPSWVDESCRGVGWQRDKGSPIHVSQPCRD